MFKYVLCFIAVLSVCAEFSAQKNIYPEGEIVIRNLFKRYRGEVVSENSEHKQFYRVKKKDTINIDNDKVKRRLTNIDIDMFQNRKYHYSRGYLFSYSLGFFDEHFQSEFTLSKMFKSKFSIGAGIGSNSNSTYFFSAVSDHRIEVKSIPLFFRGQYFINKGANRFFLEGRAGYSINYETLNTPQVDNGLVLEAGLGVLFATKHRIRHSISLTQYTLKAKGQSVNRNEFAKSDINFNIWFNSLAIKYSLIIGR